MDKGEIIIYQPDDKTIQFEVRIEDDTVWLTQAQMVDLFGRDRTVITRHINNIFKERELVEKSNVHFLHIAISDKPVKLYSLDVIISVGYRIKSLRGTQFRIWANKVLKSYLLKGYAVRQQFEHIEKKLEQHDKILIEHSQQFELLIKSALPPREGIFFNGQIFDAWQFNDQYPAIDIKIFTKSHDRFLIIDQTIVYHIGASLKDLGKKWFAFSKIKLDVNEMMKKLEKRN